MNLDFIFGLLAAGLGVAFAVEGNYGLAGVWFFMASNRIAIADLRRNQ